MADDLTQLSANELLALYRSKATSPVEVTKAVLGRIATLQPHFNAYRVIDTEAALAQARASEERWQRGAPQGALDGVPVGFKDLLNVQGLPTRKGSLATSDKPQTEDSPVAARLRESGQCCSAKHKPLSLAGKASLRRSWQASPPMLGIANTPAAAAAAGRLCRQRWAWGPCR